MGAIVYQMNVNCTANAASHSRRCSLGSDHWPVCERLCILRFSRREKLLLQVGHRWGFSLVWVRMWMSILYLRPQKDQKRLNSTGGNPPPPPPFTYTRKVLTHLALNPLPLRAQPSQWQQYPESFSGLTWKSLTWSTRSCRESKSRWHWKREKHLK